MSSLECRRLYIYLGLWSHSAFLRISAETTAAPFGLLCKWCEGAFSEQGNFVSEYKDWEVKCGLDFSPHWPLWLDSQVQRNILPMLTLRMYHHCYSCLRNVCVFPVTGDFLKAVVAIKMCVSWTWTQKALMCPLNCWFLEWVDIPKTIKADMKFSGPQKKKKLCFLYAEAFFSSLLLSK